MVKLWVSHDFWLAFSAVQIFRVEADHPCLVNSGDIKDGLERCHSDVDAALNLFNVSPSSTGKLQTLTSFAD